MDVFELNVNVSMVRETLRNLTPGPLPPGVRLRSYAPGDEETWRTLQSAADAWNAFPRERFAAEFGRDPEVLAARQRYVVAPDGSTVGTATAWWGRDGARREGRLHWVAVLPDWQGRGLGRALVVDALRRLGELGHGAAWLTTSSARVAAIRLYRSVGFRPEESGAADADVWSTMLEDGWLRDG